MNTNNTLTVVQRPLYNVHRKNNAGQYAAVGGNEDTKYFYISRPWCLGTQHDYCPIVISIMSVIIFMCLCIIILLYVLNNKNKNFIFCTRRNKSQQQTGGDEQDTTVTTNESVNVENGQVWFINPIKRMPLQPVPSSQIANPVPIVNNAFQMDEVEPMPNRFKRQSQSHLQQLQKQDAFITSDSFRYSSSSSSSSPCSSAFSSATRNHVKPIYKRQIPQPTANTTVISTIDELPPDYDTAVTTVQNEMYFPSSPESTKTASSAAIISDLIYVV